MKLNPDWVNFNVNNTSSWSKHEIRKDWSIDQFHQQLTKIGLDVISAGGNCPVQVEAALPNGHELYFRARGRGWLCEIEDLNLYADGDYGQEPFAAGYMPLSEAFVRIEQSLGKWGMPL